MTSQKKHSCSSLGVFLLFHDEIYSRRHTENFINKNDSLVADAGVDTLTGGNNGDVFDY